MIESHLVDSWSSPVARDTGTFHWAMILGGFGAPLFLQLAGMSVALSAGAKFRRTGNRQAACLAVMRRGGEIFLLAFGFRLQAWILGWAPPHTLLRVDILNIMGPAIVASAAMWGLWSTPGTRAAGFLLATLLIAFVTPAAWQAPSLAVLPDPIEAYIRPTAGMTSFAIMPWAGFVTAGALLGVMLETILRSADVRRERRLNLAFVVGGAILAGVSYAASHLPSLTSGSSFWTTAPAYFFLRVGALTCTIGMAYAWEQRPWGQGRWSPVRQLGRTSLFIYWIHVEMVYGLISLPLHAALTVGQVTLALILFTAFMLACSIGKDRLVGWWEGRRRRDTAAVGSAG